MASKVFAKYDIKFNLFTKLGELDGIVAVNNPDVILYGTGWQVNFSKVIKKICFTKNIKSIALIDHWTSYKKRFDENCLPDFILVMDDLAHETATKEFNESVNVVEVKNYFLEDMTSKFSAIKNKTSNSIVFISEPTTHDKPNLNNYEYKLLEDLLHNFDNIIVRLHPTESENKYDEVLTKFSTVNVSIIKPYEEDLLITLSKSKLTVGLSSMALYISYLCGINTISYVSNSGRVPTIPLPKEYVLKDLKELKKIRFKSVSENKLYSKAIPFDKMLKSVFKGN